MRWAPALLMRSSFHCLSSAPSGIAIPGCSRSLPTNPSSDIDMYRMTSRMTSLLRPVPVRLTVVEQHPEPSDGHRCSGVLEDGPQQDCLLTGMLLSVAMPRARPDARRPGAPPDSKRVARGDRRVDPLRSRPGFPRPPARWVLVSMASSSGLPSYPNDL